MEKSSPDQERDQPSQQVPEQNEAPPAVCTKDVIENTAKGHRPRQSRKGFGARKRVGLKIDAELTADTSQGSEAESRNDESTPSSAGGTGTETASSNIDDEEIPWWILEYRCPPPGHLGAHVVPVAAQDQPQSLNTSSFGKHTEGEPPATDVPAAKSMIVHETPERAQRRTRLHGSVPAAPCLDSSPSQKRKIIHLHDQDPSALASMVVTKELKRFHETSSPRQSSPSNHSITTPSKLVQSLTDIDIARPSTSGTSASTSSDANASTSSDANASSTFNKNDTECEK